VDNSAELPAALSASWRLEAALQRAAPQQPAAAKHSQPAQARAEVSSDQPIDSQTARSAATGQPLPGSTDDAIQTSNRSSDPSQASSTESGVAATKLGPSSELAGLAPRAAGPAASSPAAAGSNIKAELVQQRLEQMLRARRQQAATKAVNRMTLRNTASMQVELAGLGRIRVDARSRAGEVEVGVRASDAATVAVLQSLTGAMEQDLRTSSIDLAHLEVSEDKDQESEDNAARADQREAESRKQDRKGESDGTQPDEQPTPMTSKSKSVRIVL